MEKHLPNIFVGIWALLLCAMLLYISKLVRPESRSETSSIPFESGERPEGRPWVKTTASYHLLLAGVVLFVSAIFFLYPAAAAFRTWIDINKGVKALAEVSIFLAVLGVALAYFWKKGDLDWKTSQGAKVLEANSSEELNGRS